MAKPRKDWNLGSCTAITTKDQTIEITKPKPASTTVTVIDAVNNESALLAHINSVERPQVDGEGKPLEKAEPLLTVADILKDYVNENIVGNARIALRQSADPDLVVNKAVDKLKKMFPNLSDEQIVAMSAMMKESVS